MLALDIKLRDFNPVHLKQTAFLLVVKVGTFEERFLHVNNKKDHNAIAGGGVFSVFEESKLCNGLDSIIKDSIVEVKLLRGCNSLLGSGRVEGCQIDASYLGSMTTSKSTETCSFEVLGGSDLNVALWYAQDNRRDLPLISIGCVELSICFYRLKLIVNTCLLCHTEQSINGNTLHADSSNTAQKPQVLSVLSFDTIDDDDREYDSEESVSDSSLNEFMKRFDGSCAVKQEKGIPPRRDIQHNQPTPVDIDDMYDHALHAVKAATVKDNDIIVRGRLADSNITKQRSSKSNHLQKGSRVASKPTSTKHKKTTSKSPSSTNINHQLLPLRVTGSSPTYHPPRLDPVYPTNKVRVLLTADETKNYLCHLETENTSTYKNCVNHEPQPTISDAYSDSIVMSRRMTIKAPIKPPNPLPLFFDNT